MKEQMRVRKKNSGFSLVELIIAVAIMAIVIGSVCSFIIIGSRGYARSNNDISVQQEAQLAFNQMSDIIIDATRSINYVGYDSGNQPVKALKDAEFAFSPEKKALIVYNLATDDGSLPSPSASPSASPAPTLEPVSDGRKNYMFYWQKDDETLYFSEMDASGDFPMPGDADCVMLAEHVTEFEVDLSQVEERRVVKLHMLFDVGGKKFEMTNNITVRNQVLINDAAIEPLDKRVSVNVKVKEPYVIIEPGETYHFSIPKVFGMNLMNKNVVWSIEGAVNTGTQFTDTTNGILQIAGDENHQSFQVKATSVAVNDEDGMPASDTITVYVKRVTKVTLSKLSDDFDGEEEDRPQPTEIMQGATFVIGASVDGVKLLSPCSGCGADYSTDKDVTDFIVTAGNSYVTQEGTATVTQAEYRLAEDVPVGTKITIRATSVLSKRHSATYGPVHGEITLTVVEKKSPVKPYGGVLKHGRFTRIDDMLISGFVIEVSNHILCIHVVDNETNQLVSWVVCRNDDWNMWVSPDLFALDLQKSYTFYLQAIESVSKENYANWQADGGASTGGGVIVSSNEEIWAEYSANKQNVAPYAYTGTKFRCSEVYSTVLGAVEFSYAYNGQSYQGEQFTLDTFNMTEHEFENNVPENILEGVVFEKDESKIPNIDANSLNTGVVYSVYKGAGDNASEWEELYVYNPQWNDYSGSQWHYEGNMVIGEHAGMRTMQILPGKINDLKGTYHVVPGYVYDPREKATEHRAKYILGPENYKYPYEEMTAPRYYEFENSTFHVSVVAEGTMDMDTTQFKGSVCFPLPKEMKSLEYFPNLESTNWQEANLGTSGLKLGAIEADTGNMVRSTFDKIRYRKVQNENAYEVEPLKVTKIQNGNGLEVQYSYGIYKCEATGVKWECEKAEETKTNATLSFEQNGKTYVAYVPLPTDDGFMFEKEQPGRQYGGYYAAYGVEQEHLPENTGVTQFSSSYLYCDYNDVTKVYTLTFVNGASTLDGGLRTELQIKGQYQCKVGDTWWSRTHAEGSIIENNANLSIPIVDQNKRLEFCIPSPQDTSFWTSTWSDSEQTKEVWSNLYYYEINDTDSVIKQMPWWGAKYRMEGNQYRINLYQIGQVNGQYTSVWDIGTFVWNENTKQWQPTSTT